MSNECMIINLYEVMNETISRISIPERIILENYLGAECLVQIISQIFSFKRCLVKHSL